VSPLATLATVLVLGVLLLACLVMMVGSRVQWLRRSGPYGCPSVSTMVGSGRDARPDGLRCYRRPGHRGSHIGFDPADGRVHTWAQEW
jgi:hypothetical protein